jgi:emopamil binding protein
VKALRERPIDAVFAVFFALFCIGWLVFDLPAAVGLIDESTGFYAREIDPIFRDPPLWLQTVGWFAACYGPIYAAIAYGFVRDRPWLPNLVLPFAGLITATNVIYWVEELAGDVRPLNMTAFVALNLPYLVIPPLAALRVALRGRPGATALP